MLCTNRVSYNIQVSYIMKVQESKRDIRPSLSDEKSHQVPDQKIGRH